MSKILILLLYLLFLPIISQAWWNNSYPYAEFSLVTNPNTNNIIYVNINNGSGMSNTTTIFTNGSSLSNFNSSNFILNGTSILPYYINSINGTIANVSVNVSNVTGTLEVGYYWTNLTDFGSSADINTTFSANRTNFTSFIETDPSSQLTINNNTKITITNQANSNSYIRKDFGTGTLSGDQITRFDFVVVSSGGAGDSSHWLWTEGNTAYTTGYPSGDFIGLYFNANGNGVYMVYNGAGYGNTVPVTLGTRYFIKFERIGNSVTWTIRSDSQSGTVVYSFQKTTDTVSYRYITLAYLGGQSYQITGDIQNLIWYQINSPLSTWTGWGNIIYSTSVPTLISNSVYGLWTSFTIDLSNLTSMVWTTNYDMPSIVSWFINGTLVQSTNQVTSSTYTNSSPITGVWNLTVSSQNYVNSSSGFTNHSWIWFVNTTTVSQKIEQVTVTIS